MKQWIKKNYHQQKNKLKMKWVKYIVLLNVDSGTFFYCSKYVPGNKHDMKLLKETSYEVENDLCGSFMLCDKGYVNIVNYIPQGRVCRMEYEKIWKIWSFMNVTWKKRRGKEITKSINVIYNAMGKEIFQKQLNNVDDENYFFQFFIFF